MVVKITDHVDRSLDRTVEQYKEKPLIEGMLSAFSEEKQDLEGVFCELLTERIDIDVAEGVQLDLVGTIVDQARLGFDDEFYRILLKVKIGINNSKGEPESVINTMKLIAQATEAQYLNFGNGNIGLAVNTLTGITPDNADFIYQQMERVVMAGVRINYISCYDPDEPFSFDGIGPLGLGFSSLAAPLEGGKFASLHRRTTPFAFDGDDDALGFSTLGDTLVGGVFVGL